MLTVFHTADWHLGQSFCGFDRGYEHDCFLTWLLRTLELHQPNAMIVSGDIFDTVNPSAIAQKRFYEFLSKVAKSMLKMLVLMTAGNHDAVARLEAPAPLLNSMNIHVDRQLVAADACRQQERNLRWPFSMSQPLEFVGHSTDFVRKIAISLEQCNVCP